MALTCEVFKDLQGNVRLTDLPPKTAFFVALPDPVTRGIPVEPPADKAEARRVEALGRYVLQQSLQNLGLSMAGGEWRFFGGGHIAMARALSAATEALAHRTIQTCIVMGIDSLVDPFLLRELLRERRIKTSENPVGFIPGEFGAAFLLSAVPFMFSEPKTPRVLIRAVKLAEHPRPAAVPTPPPDGRALAECVLSVLDAAGRAGGEPRFISDHNGEQKRAHEWGMLQLHLTSKGVGSQAHRSVWFPAVGFGEVGAATGAAGLCIALRSLQRGYSQSSSIILTMSEEAGGRAAMLVSVQDTSSK
ncbi:hypothetical protein [Archangium minus]|uniref:hypothetical protein n=1 Tax=Archangium TaxID=47 RepID=UPI0037BE63C6